MNKGTFAGPLIPFAILHFHFSECGLCHTSNNFRNISPATLNFNLLHA